MQKYVNLVRCTQYRDLLAKIGVDYEARIKNPSKKNWRLKLIGIKKIDTVMKSTFTRCRLAHDGSASKWSQITNFQGVIELFVSITIQLSPTSQTYPPSSALPAHRQICPRQRRRTRPAAWISRRRARCLCRQSFSFRRCRKTIKRRKFEKSRLPRRGRKNFTVLFYITSYFCGLLVRIKRWFEASHLSAFLPLGRFLFFFFGGDIE